MKVRRQVEQIRQEEGYINFLFVNHGVSGPRDASALSDKSAGKEVSIEDYQKTLWDLASPEDYTKTLHVNVTGVYYTAIAFLGLLDAGNKKRNVPQDSQIVVTTSIAGFSRALASSYAYSTSKAAANHLVKMLATSFAQSGFHIRVNTLAPVFAAYKSTRALVDQCRASTQAR
jgi:NAD(P)-dependent dehydrogenase (short-subunit alcohol dehydrogenase family)